MSHINIKRVVENIRTNTTVYTPVVEMVVNAIQAIDATARRDGKIQIRVRRSSQTELDAGLPQVTGFEIADNGIGFNDTQRNSFDTLYTDLKITEGGKGFGRFTGLKYFNNVYVQSVYRDGDVFKDRCFSMGKKHEIIVAEKVTLSDKQDTGTVVALGGFRDGTGF